MYTFELLLRRALRVRGILPRFDQRRELMALRNIIDFEQHTLQAV